MRDWCNGETLAARAFGDGVLCRHGADLALGRSGVVATWAGDGGYGAAFVLHHLPDDRWWEEIVVLARHPDGGWEHYQGDGPDETDLTAQRRAKCFDGEHLIAWPSAALDVAVDGPADSALLQVVHGTACHHVATVEWSVDGVATTLVPDPSTGVFLHGALAPDPHDIVLRALRADGSPVADAVGDPVRRVVPTGGSDGGLADGTADADRPGLAEVLGCELHFGRGESTIVPTRRAFSSGRPTTPEDALFQYLTARSADFSSPQAGGRLSFDRLAAIPPSDPTEVVFAGRFPDRSVHAVVTVTRGGTPGRWCVTHAVACHLPRA